MNPVSETTRLLSLYWGCSLGGVAKYATLLDSSVRYSSVEILHVCVRGKAWPTDEQTLDALGAEILWIRSRGDLSWIRSLKKQIEDYSPAMIMTHGFNGHFVIQLMRVLGYYKRSVICSYHGEYHPTTRGRRLISPFFNKFTEWYIRHSLATVSVAEYTKRYLVQKGVDEDRIEVIHNGIRDVKVDPCIRQKLREEWNIGADEKVIGVASRLDPVKGVEFLVSAFARLTRNRNDVVLVLVGSGTREVELRKQVERLGVTSRVRFAGFREDVAECLSAFDIFALPSLAEYHSIGLLEAMRAGKPIVATDVGGNTESVRAGLEALVVPPANVDELESALGRLLSDDGLAERLAQNARRRFLAEFTEDVMLRRTGAWLTRCASLSER